jgi:hypothetical protein
LQSKENNSNDVPDDWQTSVFVVFAAAVVVVAVEDDIDSAIVVQENGNIDKTADGSGCSCCC